jgi:uncharacterized membrane protein YeaQ/YmgE (transglycosylase-associated protein family)
MRAAALGVTGAIVGGGMSRYFGAASGTLLSIQGAVVAVVGSIVVLAGYYSVSSPDRTDAPPV